MRDLRIPMDLKIAVPAINEEASIAPIFDVFLLLPGVSVLEAAN